MEHGGNSGGKMNELRIVGNTSYINYSSRYSEYKSGRFEVKGNYADFKPSAFYLIFSITTLISAAFQLLTS